MQKYKISELQPKKKPPNTKKQPFLRCKKAVCTA